MKAHRQYVKEQIKHDRRFAKDLEEARIQVRIAVMIARIESGDYLPTLETPWKLADALGAQCHHRT